MYSGIKYVRDSNQVFHIEYWIFNRKKVALEDLHKCEENKYVIKSPRGAACFNGIFRYSHEVSGNPSLYYSVRPISYMGGVGRIDKLGATQVESWMHISIQNGWLPETTKILPGCRQEIVLNLDAIPITKVYLYLCILRYIKEFPYVISNTLNFIEYGMNPFIALFAAHKCGTYYTGHCITSDVIPYYMEKIEKRKVRIDLESVRRFYKHVMDPGTCAEEVASESTRFNYFSSVYGNINGEVVRAYISTLRRPSVERYIYMNDAEAKEYRAANNKERK